MPVVMMVDNPNGTAELYEKVRAELAPQRPAGGILHVAGASPTGGFRVIELWETREEAERFLRESLQPTLKAAGAAGPPPRVEFWPVHNYLA
jgi:hypothetical protein